MNELNLAVFLIGFLVIVIGTFSKVIRASFVSGPFDRLWCRIVLGPVLLNLLHVARWDIGERDVLE